PGTPRNESGESRVGGKKPRHSGEFPSCAYRHDSGPRRGVPGESDLLSTRYPGVLHPKHRPDLNRTFSRGPQSSGLRRHPQVPIRIPRYRLPGVTRRSGKHGASLSKSPALQGWGYLLVFSSLSDSSRSAIGSKRSMPRFAEMPLFAHSPHVAFSLNSRALTRVVRFFHCQVGCGEKLLL